VVESEGRRTVEKVQERGCGVSVRVWRTKGLGGVRGMTDPLGRGAMWGPPWGVHRTVWGGGGGRGARIKVDPGNKRERAGVNGGM